MNKVIMVLLLEFGSVGLTNEGVILVWWWWWKWDLLLWLVEEAGC